MGLSKPTRSPRSNARGATAAALRPSVAATYSRAQAGGALCGLRSRALVRPTLTPATFFASSHRAAFASGSPSPNSRSTSQAAERNSAGISLGAYCGPLAGCGAAAPSSKSNEAGLIAVPSHRGNSDGFDAAQVSPTAFLDGGGALQDSHAGATRRVGR